MTKNPSGTSGRVLCVCYETENRVFDDQQQAHFEFALCGDTVQAIFIKTEALACGQLIVLTLIADDGFAFQRGQDGVAGCTVRGQAGALVKGHQHEFHVVGVSQVQVGDAALFVRDQVLQFGGCACFEDAVHRKVLLFEDDFGIDKAVVGAGAAQRSGRETVMAGRMGRTCEGVKSWLNIKRTPCVGSGAASSTMTTADGSFFIVYPFCRVKSMVITTEYEK